MNNFAIATDMIEFRALMSLILIVATLTAVWALARPNNKKIYQKGVMFLGVGGVIHFCSLYATGTSFVLISATTATMMFLSVITFKKSIT